MQDEVCPRRAHEQSEGRAREGRQKDPRDLERRQKKKLDQLEQEPHPELHGNANGRAKTFLY